MTEQPHVPPEPPTGWSPAPGHPPAAPGPPAVPDGPGVRPPFAAAPVEGRTARIWLGLGIAGGLLVLCCGAGIAAVAGLAVTGVEALNEQARTATDDYLSARVERDWEQAYQQRCEQDQRQESLREYTRRVSDLPPIESYQLDEIEMAPRGQVQVPATLTYADGDSERVLVPLVQDSETGQFEVCGFDR